MAALELRPAQIPARANELKDAMNEALKAEWIESRGITVEKIALNPITLTPDDMEKIQQMEDAATLGSNPFMMAGRMTDATASSMENAAKNPAGAMTGFMGMGMAGGAMGGGFGAAQGLYNTGVQQAQAKAEADGWKCSCGAENTGNFCQNCGSKKLKNDGWTCSCGATNTGNFCQNCGSKKPKDDSWLCSCGTKNTGNFCQNCGERRK
jgi:membrane protease subunit (stomatin/prohibitin family)